MEEKTRDGLFTTTLNYIGAVSRGPLCQLAPAAAAAAGSGAAAELVLRVLRVALVVLTISFMLLPFGMGVVSCYLRGAAGGTCL